MSTFSPFVEKFLSCDMNYCHKTKSFSPLYSYINIVSENYFAGINALHADYNRKSPEVWAPFMQLSSLCNFYEAKPDHISFSTEKKSNITISYYAENAFLVEGTAFEKINLFCKPGKDFSEMWTVEKHNKMLLLQGYIYNRDDRDPDQKVGFMAGIKMIKGIIHQQKDKIFVTPDENNLILLSFTMDIMTFSAYQIKHILNQAPLDSSISIDTTRKWIAECIGSFDANKATPQEENMLLLAIGALIFNLCKTKGNLEGYISSFPSRGSYTTHFMWDSAFQNLAYEKMNMDVAKDALLLLIANMRPDGKIPQFLCNTWVRPHEVQPALIAWAADRIYEQTQDKSFIKQIFTALEINNVWWLTQRMTRFGVVYCPHGLETGQDNSPRFDDGPVLAVDMNAYLLSQFHICAKWASILGKQEKAKKWNVEADKLSKNIIKWLYDEEKNLFFDALPETGEKRPLVTTSGLIPLFGDVSLPQGKAKEMIEKWLINPKYMFGQIPFPSVAYTESVYDPKDWWRGPTWPSEAWLMLEILEKYGFKKERKIACERLYQAILKNGQHYELLNSETGEGEGNPEQGWSAAVFIRLFSEKYQ